MCGRDSDLRLEHLVSDAAQWLNPMVVSCYADEDYIGKIKGLAKRSHPLGLGRQCLDRYAAYVCCRWLRQMGEK